MATDIRAEPLAISVGGVLRIPAMRRLWIAQLVSTFGDFLALFAVISFFTFRLRATPEQVTGLQLAYLLPIAVLGLIAGVFVDLWPPKVTLVASDLTRAILCLLLIPSANARPILRRARFRIGCQCVLQSSAGSGHSPSGAI